MTVTAQIDGLEQGLMFQYQLVAVHGTGTPTSGADASFETFPSPTPKPVVTSSTSPRSLTSGPYTFLTEGRIINPSTVTPAALACAGTADISLAYDHRTLAAKLVPIQADCTYAGSVTLTRLPGHGSRARVVKVAVYVHYSGDDYLAAGGANKATLTLR